MCRVERIMRIGTNHRRREHRSCLYLVSDSASSGSMISEEWGGGAYCLADKGGSGVSAYDDSRSVGTRLRAFVDLTPMFRWHVLGIYLVSSIPLPVSVLEDQGGGTR